MGKTAFAYWMDKSGKKAEEIAFHAGVTVGYVYKLRRGDKSPSMDLGRRLCEIVGAPPRMDIFLPGFVPKKTNPDEQAAAQEPA